MPRPLRLRQGADRDPGIRRRNPMALTRLRDRAGQASVDRTAAATGTAAAMAEIAALRQKLAAAAARIQEEMGRRKATEVDRDNAFKPFTSWKSDKIKSAPRLHFCAT